MNQIKALISNVTTTGTIRIIHDASRLGNAYKSLDVSAVETIPIDSIGSNISLRKRVLAYETPNDSTTNCKVINGSLHIVSVNGDLTSRTVADFHVGNEYRLSIINNGQMIIVLPYSVYTVGDEFEVEYRSSLLNEYDDLNNKIAGIHDIIRTFKIRSDPSLNSIYGVLCMFIEELDADELLKVGVLSMNDVCINGYIPYRKVPTYYTKNILDKLKQEGLYVGGTTCKSLILEDCKMGTSMLFTDVCQCLKNSVVSKIPYLNSLCLDEIAYDGLVDSYATEIRDESSIFPSVSFLGYHIHVFFVVLIPIAFLVSIIMLLYHSKTSANPPINN